MQNSWLIVWIIKFSFIVIIANWELLRTKSTVDIRSSFSFLFERKSIKERFLQAEIGDSVYINCLNPSKELCNMLMKIFSIINRMNKIIIATIPIVWILLLFSSESFNENMSKYSMNEINSV